MPSSRWRGRTAKGCCLCPSSNAISSGATARARQHRPRPAPITRDWVGILHDPFEAPDWFDPRVSPETFFDTDLWRASRPHCRGIIVLAADLGTDLRAYDPDLAVLSVFHPVEMQVKMFDTAAYRAHPRVVQVGDWLRKLQAIHRLKAPGHERVMLLKEQDTKDYLQTRDSRLRRPPRPGRRDAHHGAQRRV